MTNPDAVALLDVVKSRRALEQEHRKKMGQLREMRDEFLRRLRQAGMTKPELASLLGVTVGRVQQLLGPGG